MRALSAELDRRRLLRYLGRSALALPFFRVLQEEQLFGATPAKRALFFYFPDGIIKERWHPTSVGRDFAFQPMTAPLETVRDDVILLKNVHSAAEGSHEGGAAYILSGIRSRNAGITIDTYLGEKFKSDVPRPVVRLGVAANFQSGGAPISFFAPGAASPIEDHPAKAFYDIFGASDGSIDPIMKNKLLAAELSVLDFCKDDIKGLQTRLGTVEQQKLSLHLESLRELERRVQTSINNPVDGVCTRQLNMRGLNFPSPDHSYPPAPHKNESFAVIGDIMTDLAVQVFACGVSRVQFFQWSHPVSPTGFDFPGGTSQPRGHHDISHYGDLNGSGAQEFIKTQAWYMERLSRLVQRLKDLKEGDQTLLYNTAIMACTEIADANLHDFQNTGLVLAGQAGGSWTSGRCLDGNGASHNQVLVSMLQAMGLTDTSFGDPRLGTGPLPGLTA